MADLCLNYKKVKPFSDLKLINHVFEILYIAQGLLSRVMYVRVPNAAFSSGHFSKDLKSW